MRRREFISVLGGVAASWPLAARAQRPARASKRLALFSPPEPTALMNEHGENRYWRALFGHLRQLGYVEGQNLVIERYGREQQDLAIERYGRDQSTSALVADAVRSNPDVVYVVGSTVALLFKRQTDKIPIVALTGDPVAANLVQSLAHPGGNITGVSTETAPSLHGKRIALLREILPDISKLTYLTTRVAWERVPQGPPMRAAADAAGIALDVSLIELPSGEAAYGEAIAKSLREGANAIMLGDTPDALANHSLIVKLIGAAKLPATYPFPEFVDVGGLMAYSFDLMELVKIIANDIDAILRGANPGDIPYYQASKFVLWINLKTAKALGLTVPATLLTSADKVIE